MNQTRRAQDVNRCFDLELEPCPSCGPVMRFELEIACLIEEHGSDPADSELVVSWRYGLNPRATSIYCDAAAGLRRAQ